MSSFIRLDKFAEKYEVDFNYLYALKCKKLIPDKVLNTKQKNYSEVDETYFVERKKLQRRVWMRSHELYFFLIEYKYKTPFQLAEALHKLDTKITKQTWSSYLHSTLFLTQSESILNYKVKGLNWKFWRFSRWMVLSALKELKFNRPLRDVSKILY